MTDVEKRAAAYDAIARIVHTYLPPDSGIDAKDAFGAIISVVDVTDAPENENPAQLALPLAA